MTNKNKNEDEVIEDENSTLKGVSKKEVKKMANKLSFAFLIN